MNKYCLGIFLSLLMAMTVWAQGTNAPFDMAKTQKELEIMRGIFKTTLSFNPEDSQRDPIFNLADIRFLYLPDQGVNFYVQNPGFFSPPIAWDDIKIQFDEAALHTDFEKLGIDLERMQERLKTQVLSLEELHSRSETDEEKEKALEARSDIEDEKEIIKRQQKAVEAQRAEILERQKEMKQQIQVQKEKTAKQQEERRQKLSVIKESLIEAVAGYGDSLTTVKSDEYINLVFDTSGQYDVVSIQKSWIRDYKAGRLTLDQLKAKAIQYSMKGR